MRKDPDTTGVVSVIGVTPINATPNAGRLAITLRSRDDRQAPVNAVIERLQRAVAAVPGVVVFFRPVQDIQISTRLSRGQYQYTLTSTDANEVGDWATRLTQQLQKSEVLRDVASEAQDNGLGMDIQIDREMAGRLGVSMQTVIDTLSDAFGQRQISTIYGQANQYRVILEAEPEYQNDPGSLAKLYVPASGVQAVAQPTSLTSTSNAIMMIDFALEAERKQGLSPRESIVQASLLRFRPMPCSAPSRGRSKAAPARSCAIPSASPSSAGSTQPVAHALIYLAMERVKTRLSRPAPLQTELDLPDQPEPSQHPAE